MEPEMWTRKQVMAHLGIGSDKLNRWIKAGVAPHPVGKMGCRGAHCWEADAIRAVVPPTRPITEEEVKDVKSPAPKEA